MMLQHHAVGTFPSYEATETALRELRLNNFAMDLVSVVGLDIHQRTEMAGANTSNRLVSLGDLESQNNQAGEKAVDGAIAGVTVGGFAGLLVGLGGLIIPGVGPLILAGTSAMAIAGMISGGVLGSITGGLVGALVGVGIPEDRAEIYSNQISQGNYLIMVEGTNSDITFAESILDKHDINGWYVYNTPNRTVTTVSTTTSSHPTADRSITNR
ncbi:signal transduction histidine kinase (STHK), LytS [Synechocystis salina LEGE 06099]|nr:signal transduction histidine kinase (STHK), LytS [Synechocystis salina LEGE 06099]